jgi:GNAT superfamily N-acetyltransferase
MKFRELTQEDINGDASDALAGKIMDYYRDSKTMIDINLGVVKANWSVFMSSGMAVVIAAEDDDKIVGLMSGLHYHDPLSGRKIAQEVFWFVDPEYRYRGLGESLIKLFSAWAKTKSATVIRVAHLVDLRAEENKKMYEAMGFRASEIAYEKEV